MIKWFSKFSMSKVITWVFIIFYLISITASAFVKIKWEIDLSSYLEFLQPIIMTIIVSYFTKSSIENYATIKNNNQG